MRYLFLIFLTGYAGILPAQDKQIPPFTWDGYAEIYYSLQMNNPRNHLMPAFLYNYNRANEVDLNLALVKLNYDAGNLRANLAIGYGTYMDANYAKESYTLKNLFEASIGVKIARKSALWIDAGILPSHIGFESPVGKDNWTLTRSLSAENSPYFEAGVRLAYTSKNKKWYWATLVVNGWQTIERQEGNGAPSFGEQIMYKPSERFTFNFSAMAGNDKPDSQLQMRYFLDLYGILQLDHQWGVSAGFDFGVEEKPKAARGCDHWFAPLVIIRFKANEKLDLAARGEYYGDYKEVMVETNTPHGFRVLGISANTDLHIGSNAVWRVELKDLISRDPIFTKQNGSLTRNNISVISALAISF